MKSLRILLAFAVVLTLMSSCKKADITKTSILTSHKWVLASSSTTYSDTSLVTNNLAGRTEPCEKDGYTEFRNYINGSATTRQFYNYTETKCVNETADVTSGDWDLDKDEAFLTMSGTGGGQSWNWAITSLDDSKIVLTSTESNTAYKYVNGVYTPYTRTVTTVQNWTSK